MKFKSSFCNGAIKFSVCIENKGNIVHLIFCLLLIDDHKIIDVDTFNNILDNWEFMGYKVKQYTMHNKGKKITVFYWKGVDK